MNAGQLKKSLSSDWCFIGVILFFIVHGYYENQFLIPFKELLFLLVILVASGAVVFFLFKRIFRNGRKAGLFAAFAFTIVLFFGVIQDYLSGTRYLSPFIRLTILLPVSIGLLLVFFIWLKWTKLPFNRTVLFVNTLLLLYVIVDLFIITARFISRPENRDRALSQYSLRNCDTCEKPPVYFILLDSYFGSIGMKEIFNYDNSRFDNFLQSQGFHVSAASHSNYYYTLYSMASLMNMDYLGDIGRPIIKNYYGYSRATDAMRNNIVCRYLSSLGYRINNYSTFDLPNVPAGYKSGLLPDKIQLITHKTLYYRVKKYLPLYLARKGWVKQVADDIEEEYIDNNEKMMAAALEESKRKYKNPSFTYLHLMMPHGPFVYDSTGKRTHIMRRYASLSPDELAQSFLQYQVYTNKKMEAFIIELQKQTGGNAVIILMSDHGYQPAYNEEKKMAYYNLNAVYLPSKRYEGWYDGISNVNQFRVLFNTLYGQQLPLLKDLHYTN